jgi:hypothetical protein
MTVSIFFQMEMGDLPVFYRMDDCQYVIQKIFINIPVELGLTNLTNRL